ncbi:dihydrolipoamide acetyltransferase family protein [Nocardia pseudobrasiliensis]|uniref:Dihydrolipoamide acetyltransferase component of pyruvate dehydrogenase complex n=1 Tax=Nocardia pseudobrasiliensis TaxID=45979 RepID=A0A370IDU0_9NOCA|nr:dihydrolipoamide acetyltransferase family protein [Nocardia pseudobrasiliensis]RDI68311.1 pyruvate dehydrogenase E2 component (dihydrolipoamide acetyltransferase) [Nocardia pseudobrasiliensis]
MAEFRMPSLGADMTEGTLLRWLVHPGDAVHKGDIVAEVDTTKAAIEIECFDDGVMGEFLVAEGTTVPVGTVLATITHAAEPAPAHADVHATPLIHKLAEEAGLDLAAVRGSAPGGRIVRADIEHAVAQQESAKAALATPRTAPTDTASGVPTVTRATGYARRLAGELRVDLAEVTGTGPAGAVRGVDVRATIGQATPEPETPAPISKRSEPPSRDADAVRTMIAAAMTRSKQTVPHYYLSATIDVDAAVQRLREMNRSLPVAERLVLPALLFRAVARAARVVPELNGHWIDDRFQPAADVHLGVVVSLRGGGIILPTIPDADTLDPPAMMAAIRGVVARARAGRLRSADATPATITVTNLGDLGVDSVFGVIAVPQVAIVGVGAVAERPCAVDGLLGVRSQLTATLSADHRASDGAIGARLLNTISDLFRHPEEL